MDASHAKLLPPSDFSSSSSTDSSPTSLHTSSTLPFPFHLLPVDLFAAIAQWLTLRHKLLSLTVVSRSFPRLTPACFTHNLVWLSTAAQLNGIHHLSSSSLLSRVGSMVVTNWGEWQIPTISSGPLSYLSYTSHLGRTMAPFSSLLSLTMSLHSMAATLFDQLFPSPAAFPLLRRLRLSLHETQASQVHPNLTADPNSLDGTWQSMRSLAHLPSLASLTLRHTHMDTDTFAFLLSLPLHHLDLRTVELWRGALARDEADGRTPKPAPPPRPSVNSSISSLILPKMKQSDDQYLSTLLTRLGRSQQVAGETGERSGSGLRAVSTDTPSDNNTLEALVSSPLSSSLTALHVTEYARKRRVITPSLPHLRHLHCPADNYGKSMGRGLHLVHAVASQLLSLDLDASLEADKDGQHGGHVLTAIAACTLLTSLTLCGGGFDPPPSPLLLPTVRRVRLTVPSAALCYILSACPALEVCELRAADVLSWAVMAALAELRHLLRVVCILTPNEARFFNSGPQEEVLASVRQRPDTSPPLFPSLISLHLDRLNPHYPATFLPVSPDFLSGLAFLLHAAPLRYLSIQCVKWRVQELAPLSGLRHLRALGLIEKDSAPLRPFCYHDPPDTRETEAWLDEVSQWQEDMRQADRTARHVSASLVDWLEMPGVPLPIALRFVEERVFADGTMDGREAFFAHVAVQSSH